MSARSASGRGRTGFRGAILEDRGVASPAQICTRAGFIAVALAVTIPLALLGDTRAVGLLAQSPEAPTVVPRSTGAIESCADAATEVWLRRVPEAERVRAAAYAGGNHWLRLWRFLVLVAACWLILAVGWSRKIRDYAHRTTRVPALRVGLYVVPCLATVYAVAFPLTFYADFVRERAYGLGTQSLGSWLQQEAVGGVIALLLLWPILALAYLIVRRRPRTWWVWCSGLSAGVLVLYATLAPVYLDPLFNTFRPVDDPAVVASIERLAESNGLAIDGVYQYDASSQTTRVNANVAGLFGTMRVQLNDNLLNRCSLEEIEAALAHEMGHVVLHHAGQLLAAFTLIIVVGFAFLARAFGSVQARVGGRWGIAGVHDVAGLPLLIALGSFYIFALTPVTNSLIRTKEVEADIFGLHSARRPDGFSEIVLKLGEYRKLSPSPLEEMVFFSHPSGRERIRMAMRWKYADLESRLDPSAFADTLSRCGTETIRGVTPPGVPAR